METKHREPFPLSFVGAEGDQVAPAPEVLVREVRARPHWDTAVLEPLDGQFPRLHLECYEAHGFVVQCFEDEASWGWFLASGLSLGPPAVEINLGGIWEGRQGREVWERDHASEPKIG